METFSYLVLAPMVYLAFAMFILGSLWRIIRLATRPPFKPTLKIYPVKRPGWLFAVRDAFLMPTIWRFHRVLWVFLMLFHIAMLLLILGHLELFAEMSWLQVWPHKVFLGAGWVGVTLFASLLFLLFRRFVPPAKDLSVPEDYFLLVVLLLTVIFGAEMHWARRLYSYDFMGVPEYREYLMSLLTFSPSLDGILGSGHSFMLVLHVFFANLFIMFFPCSKMMHSIFAIPVNMLRRG